MSMDSLTKTNPTSQLTARDRRMGAILNAAPWLSLALITFGPSLGFFLAYLLVTSDAAVYLLLALSAFPFALVAGIVAAILLLLIRRGWAKRLRERLASDGITADEVEWFRSELTTTERRALKEMTQRQPVLADAYRETLALRLNASRVITAARRDLLQVERRINRTAYLRAANAAELLAELRKDQARLDAIRQEGMSRKDQAEARLQMIEAAASRGASWTETSYMLQRLDEGGKQIPLALESAREEQQFREDTERELRREGATL